MKAEAAGAVPGEFRFRVRLRIAAARRWAAQRLGASLELRYNTYLSLVQAANPFDLNYWLELTFSCGIATLGLVLNSPAVIIGAMLISPLMGPILGAGLALAAGDVFLGVRALLNLGSSVACSVLGSALLVRLLPFKEITPEILARIQPTVLDLAVAIFCGFAGAFATLKSRGGMVTAIPGVAIAVALMPPLSVVGFGLGASGTLPQWAQVMRGGILLFAANFVAIVLTSMLVFLAARMDSPKLRRDVDTWQESLEHQTRLESWLARHKVWRKFSHVGTLQARLLVVLTFLALIYVPLSRALVELQSQVTARRQQESQLRVVTTVARQFFQQPNRSRVEQVSVQDLGDVVTAEVHITTARLFGNDVQSQVKSAISAKLGKHARLVLLQTPSALGSVHPMGWAEILGIKKAPENAAETSALAGQLVRPAVEELWPADRGALLDVDLSARPAGSPEPGAVTLVYLAERGFSEDAQEVMRKVLRDRLGPSLQIRFRWLPLRAGPWQYAPGQTVPPSSAREALGQLVENLKAFPNLVAQIEAGADSGDPSRRRQEIARERASLLARELEKSGVRPDRIVARVSAEQRRAAGITVAPRP